MVLVYNLLMKMYSNPSARKVRGSHVLRVSCAHCGCLIAHYRKVGSSNLVKLYLARIVDSSVDVSDAPGALECPQCGVRLATRYVVRSDGELAYRLVPGEVRSRRV